MLYALLAVVAVFVIIAAITFVPQAYQGLKEDLTTGAGTRFLA